jgi:hypothetical protein
MKYLFLNGDLAKKIYNDMSVALGDKHPYTVKNQVARFTTGHLSTEDEECSGRQLKGQFQKTWMPFIP